MLHSISNFNENQVVSFSVILLTNKQTNQKTWPSWPGNDFNLKKTPIAKWNNTVIAHKISRTDSYCCLVHSTRIKCNIRRIYSGLKNKVTKAHEDNFLIIKKHKQTYFVNKMMQVRWWQESMCRFLCEGPDSESTSLLSDFSSFKHLLFFILTIREDTSTKCHMMVFPLLNVRGLKWLNCDWTAPNIQKSAVNTEMFKYGCLVMVSSNYKLMSNIFAGYFFLTTLSAVWVSHIFLTWPEKL